MTWEQLGIAATIVGVALGVIQLIAYFRKQGRDFAEKQAHDKQDTYNRGVVDGKHSRDDEVRQLTFERDDARHDRDRYEVDAREWRARYDDIRDRGLH